MFSYSPKKILCYLLFSASFIYRIVTRKFKDTNINAQYLHKPINLFCSVPSNIGRVCYNSFHVGFFLKAD